jgi:hypothetical protein
LQRLPKMLVAHHLGYLLQLGAVGLLVRRHTRRRAVTRGLAKVGFGLFVFGSHKLTLAFCLTRFSVLR